MTKKSKKQTKKETVDQDEVVTFHYDKVKDFSTWFTEINKRAELSDQRYGVKGLVVFRAWTTVTLKIMYRLLEEDLERHGHLPVIFPALVPESNLIKEAEHVEGHVQHRHVCRLGRHDHDVEGSHAPDDEAAILTFGHEVARQVCALAQIVLENETAWVEAAASPWHAGRNRIQTYFELRLPRVSSVLWNTMAPLFLISAARRPFGEIPH